MMQAPMHPALSRRPDKSDKLEVCREFLRGICNRTEEECKFAHPPGDVVVDPMDGMITVCMDFIKSRCSRDCCKFFHPPAHLQARVKANQLGSPLSSPVSESGSNPEMVSVKELNVFCVAIHRPYDWNVVSRP